jgi:hypothetical protein
VNGQRQRLRHGCCDRVQLVVGGWVQTPPLATRLPGARNLARVRRDPPVPYSAAEDGSEQRVPVSVSGLSVGSLLAELAPPVLDHVPSDGGERLVAKHGQQVFQEPGVQHPCGWLESPVFKPPGGVCRERHLRGFGCLLRRLPAWDTCTAPAQCRRAHTGQPGIGVALGVERNVCRVHGSAPRADVAGLDAAGGEPADAAERAAALWSWHRCSQSLQPRASGYLTIFVPDWPPSTRVLCAYSQVRIALRAGHPH